MLSLSLARSENYKQEVISSAAGVLNILYQEVKIERFVAVSQWTQENFFSFFGGETICKDRGRPLVLFLSIT